MQPENPHHLLNIIIQLPSLPYKHKSYSYTVAHAQKHTIHSAIRPRSVMRDVRQPESPERQKLSGRSGVYKDLEL